MNEKYLAGLGASLIVFSFLVIILYVLFEGVDDKVVIEDGTPGFSQLKAITEEGKSQITNNTVIEEFKELVGNVTHEMKEKITVGINQTFSAISQKNSSGN